MGQNSILLVTVDCLRADHVSFAGYCRPTTPFLHSLGGESFVFPQAIAAGMPTYYSLPALLASRSPLALGRDVLGIAPDEPTLASALRKAGYATAAFTAANPYISKRFGYEQGFDAFHNFLDDAPPQVERLAQNISESGPGSRINRKLQDATAMFGPFRALYNELYFQYCQRTTPVPDSSDALRPFPAADVIVDRACEWLAGLGDSPFFLWLHFMDPHSPYYPKAEAAAGMGDEALSPFQARYWNSYWNRSDLTARRLLRCREKISRLYDAGIRWVDDQIGRLAGVLRESGQWQRCVFAVTADHGEEFLDHGGRYHPPSQLSEELIHVPLLLRVPGVPKKLLPESPVSLLDLAPTLLAAAAQPIPAEFQGRNLWSEIAEGRTDDRPVISECVAGCTNPLRMKNRFGARILAVREKQFKLVLYFDSGQEKLYDLASDPGEEKPVPPGLLIPVRRRLLETAREHLQRSNRWASDSRLRMRAQIRDLRSVAIPLPAGAQAIS